MTIQKALEILRDHNDYRRDKGRYHNDNPESIDHVSPLFTARETSEAMETLIAFTEAQKSLGEVAHSDVAHGVEVPSQITGMFAVRMSFADPEKAADSAAQWLAKGRPPRRYTQTTVVYRAYLQEGGK